MTSLNEVSKYPALGDEDHGEESTQEKPTAKALPWSRLIDMFPSRRDCQFTK